MTMFWYFPGGKRSTRYSSPSSNTKVDLSEPPDTIVAQASLTVCSTSCPSKDSMDSLLALYRIEGREREKVFF